MLKNIINENKVIPADERIKQVVDSFMINNENKVKKLKFQIALKLILF